MSKMKAYVIDPSNGEGQLALVDKPIPVAGHGMALVRVRASSLNYRDHLVRSGGYGSPVGLAGTIPLSDGAGEVVAVGPDVERIKIGDRVAANFFPAWVHGTATADQLRLGLGAPGCDGMLAEYVALPAKCLVHIPAALSFEEAATLPCAALTAWFALFETFKLHPGMTVLVQGTGGVSIFALQFAKSSGARVILTSSSNEKLEKAKALGADHTINYTETPAWDAAVRDLTCNEGVDLVIEVGGTGTLEKSIASTKTGGGIAVIGVLSGIGARLNIIPVLWKQIRLHGVYVGSRVMFERMNAGIAQTGLKPVIDQLFPFEEARAAYAHQSSQKHFGKIVIRHPS